MYRLGMFEKKIEKGLSNYALKSLIDFCNVDDGCGGFILENYAGSKKLQVGVSQEYLDEIYNIILKNKKRIANQLNDLDNFNIQKTMSDNQIITALIEAIRTTASEKRLNADYDIEYMIAKAIESNDEIFMEVFLDAMKNEGPQKAIEIALTRFHEPGEEYDELQQYLIEKISAQDFSDSKFAEYLKETFFGESLLSLMSEYKIYQMLDTDVDFINQLNGYGEEKISLDKLIELNSTGMPTVDEYLGTQKQTFIQNLKTERQQNQEALMEIVNFTMRGMEDRFNEPLYRGRIKEIDEDLKLINNSDVKITEFSERTLKMMNRMLLNNEQQR